MYERNFMDKVCGECVFWDNCCRKNPPTINEAGTPIYSPVSYNQKACSNFQEKSKPTLIHEQIENYETWGHLNE